MAYVDSDNLKEWLGISDDDDDAVLDQVCDAVTAWVDWYTKTSWQATSTSREFERLSPSLVVVDGVSTITAVKTDDNDDGTFETTWPSTDWERWPANATVTDRIYAVGSRRFPGSSVGRPTVQVTGIFGTETPPPEIIQACLIQAARVFKRRGSPEGVAGVADFGVIRVGARVDPDVAALLDIHRVPSLA